MAKDNQHLPCPCGQSSDAFSYDKNGWWKCFSCGENIHEEQLEKGTTRQKVPTKSKAKQKGLKVHVWLNTYLLWSSSVMPIQKDHLIHTRKDWIDSNTTSPLNIMGELKKSRIKGNGFEGLYLSPGHPNVNKHLLKVFKELVENYDIDGLHLDYIRFHDSGYGKNPYSIANYRKFNVSTGFNTGKLIDQYTSKEWNDYLRK